MTDINRILRHGTAVGGLSDRLCMLSFTVATWAASDTAKPDAGARRAANAAVDAIDAMLLGLHDLRARLLDEVRDADDATAARVDALLADRGDAGEETP